MAVITGSKYSDTLYGDPNGVAENDIIKGLGGDDIIWGFGGADIIGGGDGNDWIHASSGDYQAIYGENGDDVMLGDGIEDMRGGTGNNIYYVNNAYDNVSEEDGEGIDVVGSTVSYTMTYAVEHLYLDANAGAINGTGNGFDN